MCIRHAKQSLCYDGREADSNKPLADDDDDDDEVMFMSSCIFEWDSGDLELLRQTKINELMQKTGVRMPSQAVVSKAIAKAGLAWNLSQQRQDVLELSSQNQRNLCHDFKGGSFGRSFSPAMDVFGVVILKEEIFEILQKQKRQILCIQDPAESRFSP
ncbi:unnamed protein product [Clavelina lepadiformis]|uniref:Uncharacterized protein n=1 Tax=Clavelina lepadiformis TaxID=159417 RepID=A0ABP0G7S4_CLALP